QRFPFVPLKQALGEVQQLLHQEGDEWLEPTRSLRRRTHQPEPAYGFKPNVCVILMESWTAQHTGALGSPRRLTPHFDSLASHGILFANFYASGIRTNYGLGAVLCSFPSLPGRAVMKRYQAQHPFRSLSEILKDRGYVNAFAYGGDFAFDNMEGFFTQKEYDHFFGEAYFGVENGFSKWGVPDHVVFEKAASLIDSLPRPFQITILTLSNHEPFDLPDSSLRRYQDASETSRLFNCQLYADHAVGQFMRNMQALPVFDSTIFVFTADHARIGSGRYRGDARDFHVPLLIYAPALIGSEGRWIETFGSQVDIIPTLMGLLGGEYIHESWGRDLLRAPRSDPGFAPMNAYDRIASIDREYLYLETVGHEAFLYGNTASGDRIHDFQNERPEDFAFRRQRLRTYIQAAEQLSTPLPDDRNDQALVHR
ncbi:MAG: LTA synthase family protein, partial [Candidatus Zixiibacteriota bacterium]